MRMPVLAMRSIARSGYLVFPASFNFGRWPRLSKLERRSPAQAESPGHHSGRLIVCQGAFKRLRSTLSALESRPNQAGKAESMRAITVVASLGAGLLAGRALAAELIKPTIDVNDVRVVIHYVSTGDLVILQNKHGAYIDRREIRQDYRHGFSILKTHRETGARTCEIYLPNQKRPREVDDEATLSLGHELLHCLCGDYHR
jgi:hypothetical protein